MKKEDILMGQYELLAKTTSEVTGWRQTSNMFYLSATTTIVGVAAYLKDISIPATIALSFFGICICLTWRDNLLSYRKLNSAKFNVLFEMESQLAFPIFKREQEIYKNDKRERLTKIEGQLPAIFIFAYLVIVSIIIIQNLSYIKTMIGIS